MNRKTTLDSQAYITIGYLTIVIIGMMFDYDYYKRFNINIFEYADILDFLLAPVKSITLMLFAFATAIFVLIFFRLDKLWAQKRPNSYKKFNLGLGKESSDKYRPYLFIFSLFAYFLLASSIYGKKMHESFQSNGKTIEISFGKDEGSISGKLIGKNTDYIFIETKEKVIKAIPVSTDVQEIIIDRP